MADVILTGVERRFAEDEIIVTKTDVTGKIIYANDIFVEISGYAEHEILNRPHSMIRHPHMPRSIFKLLWDAISGGDEIFAYVQNRCKNGDHYWVLAHVTPNVDRGGTIVGYHSSRRVANPIGLDAIRPIYKSLRDIESGERDRRVGLEMSFKALMDVSGGDLDSYSHFIMNIAGR